MAALWRGRAHQQDGRQVHRIRTYKCCGCRKSFTVKIGTIFEASHVPVDLWLQAIHLMCASKKGISSKQLHRTLGVTSNAAWFMSHRIRKSMRDDGNADFSAGRGMVEVDKTIIGTRFKTSKPGRGGAHENILLTLVDPSTRRYKRHNRIEIMFGRLNDWHRMVTGTTDVGRSSSPPSRWLLPTCSGFEDQ